MLKEKEVEKDQKRFKKTIENDMKAVSMYVCRGCELL